MPSRTAKNWISSRPSQKLGMDAASIASVVDGLVEDDPRR